MNSEILLQVDHSGAPILKYQNNERPIIQINSSLGRSSLPNLSTGKIGILHASLGTTTFPSASTLKV